MNCARLRSLRSKVGSVGGVRGRRGVPRRSTGATRRSKGVTRRPGTTERRGAGAPSVDEMPWDDDAPLRWWNRRRAPRVSPDGSLCIPGWEFVYPRMGEAPLQLTGIRPVFGRLALSFFYLSLDREGLS